ncbi:MAG: hypothetical protein PHQ60_11605 [Sideroxydans sp.]|nr:hypothetical protein [Sideroxydans sp.]
MGSKSSFLETGYSLARKPQDTSRRGLPERIACCDFSLPQIEYAVDARIYLEEVLAPCGCWLAGMPHTVREFLQHFYVRAGIMPPHESRFAHAAPAFCRDP